VTQPAGFEGFISHQDECVVLALRGEVDLASTMPFTALIAQALTASPHIVFDMADVTFLDSTGLRGILEVFRRVGSDGSVTIRNAHAEVAHVLHVSGVDEVLNVES
jgi:anti-sigma B factor antagonist